MVTTQPGPWHRTMAAITTPAHATTPRNAQNHNQVVLDDRDDPEPAKRPTRKPHQPGPAHWTIRRYGAMWRANDPDCRGWGEDGCRITTTWNDAVAHVTRELRNRALAAIESQEAPC